MRYVDNVKMKMKYGSGGAVYLSGFVGIDL
jgi:hypothetical protein